MGLVLDSALKDNGLLSKSIGAGLSWLSPDGFKRAGAGLSTITIERDIHVDTLGVTFHRGMYYLDLSEGEPLPNDEDENGNRSITRNKSLCSMSFNVGELGNKPEKSESGDVLFHARLEPLPMPVVKGSEDVRPATLFDLCIWGHVDALRYFAEREKDDECRQLAAEVIAEYNAYVGVGSTSPIATIPQQRSIKPRVITQCNSKVSSATFAIEKRDKLSYNVPFDVVVSGKKENEVRVNVTVGAEDTAKVFGTLNDFDMSVYSAVVSLYVAGNANISIDQIYRTMTGKTGTAKPSDNHRQQLIKSMDRLISTPIELDFTEEARGRELLFDGKPARKLLRENAVMASKVTIRAENGKEVTGYVFANRPPILYYHDCVMKQLVTTPQRVIERIGDEIRFTDTKNVILRDYLLRRAAQAKNQRNRMSEKIRLDTLLEEVGMTDASRTEKSRIKKTAGKILQVLVDEGEITDFREYKAEGERYATGFEILETGKERRRKTVKKG